MFIIAVVNIMEAEAIVRANGATTLLVVGLAGFQIARSLKAYLDRTIVSTCLMRGIDAATRQVKVGDRVGSAISVISPSDSLAEPKKTVPLSL